MDFNKKKISIIIPCFNEQAGIKMILPEIKSVMEQNQIFNYEIILSNNNSTDNSKETFISLSKKLNIEQKTKIVDEKIQGYGSAYQTGIQKSTGDIYIMLDADGTYDFNESPMFLEKINEGYDLVIGNRFNKKMQKGSMPILNKFLGNPVLSFLVRILFKTKIKDVHSGMRAISKDSYKKLNVYTKGMEFASEMIIQASKKKLNICEIDISYRNRKGCSKLKAFRDGLRHLRFILLYSPDYFFIIPGFLMFIISLFLILSKTFPTLETKIILLSFLGLQMILFGLFNKFYAITHLGEKDLTLEKLTSFITIEKISFFSLSIFIIGIIISFLNTSIAFIIILSSILIIFYSLTISIIGIKK